MRINSKLRKSARFIHGMDRLRQGGIAMGMNIQNCPRCGKVFVKGMKDFCPACIKELDEQLEKCNKYLREHRGTTLDELSKAVDVAVKQITKFIQEGRISIANAPNVGYPCEVCGEPIRDKTMCDSCRQRLTKDMQQAAQDESKKQQDEQDQLRKRTIGFQIRDR